MHNITSLRGIEIVEAYGSARKVDLIAEWDWDDVWEKGDMWEGIVQCPYCGEDDPDLREDEWSGRTVKDRPVGLRSVEIRLWCQRYTCRHCGHSFGTTHPGIKRNSTLSKELVQYLAVRSRGRATQAQIARHASVASSTVRKCFNDYLEPPEELPDKPAAIGVDELHVGTGKPSVVTTALGGGKNLVYDVLEDYEVGTVKDHLDEIEPAQTPLPVVIDMSWRFRQAAQESRMPILLIVDRYHLARNANRALGNARKSLIGPSSEEDWEDRKANIYNAAEGPEEVQGRLKIGKKPVEQMTAVFKAVLWFRWILTAKISGEEADRKLREWNRAVGPPIREYFETPVIKKLQADNEAHKWRDEILNFYDHRYTNGFNEGMNNVGKTLDRIGATYSNSTLKAKLRHSRSENSRDDRPSLHSYVDTRKAHRLLDEANGASTNEPSPEGDPSGGRLESRLGR